MKTRTVCEHEHRPRPTRAWGLVAALATCWLGATIASADPPKVGRPTLVPTPLGMSSVSLGVDIELVVTFGGTQPIEIQWRLNGNDIPGATERRLFLNDVKLSAAGEYTVFAKNAEGEVVGPPLNLVVDPTFQSVDATPGKKVYHGEWVDVDGDGWVDLVVGIGAPLAASAPITWSVFLNARDGTFTPSWEEQLGWSYLERAYGDYDNDGQTDAVFGTAPEEMRPFRFYHNQGGGRFQPVWDAADSALFGRPTWVDIDNDGYLDTIQGSVIGSPLVHLNDHDGSPFCLVAEGELGWGLT